MKAYTIIEKKVTEEEIVDMNFPTGFTGNSSTIDGWTVTSQGFSLNGTFEGSAYNRLSQYDSYLHIYRDMPFIVSTFNVRDGGAEGSSSCMSYFDVYTVDDEGNETFIVRGSGYAERVWTNITVNCGNVETKHLKVRIHGNIGTHASAVTLLGIRGQKVIPGGREYEVKHTKLTKDTEDKYSAIKSYEKGQYYGN